MLLLFLHLKIRTVFSTRSRERPATCSELAADAVSKSVSTVVLACTCSPPVAGTGVQQLLLLKAGTGVQQLLLLTAGTGVQQLMLLTAGTGVQQLLLLTASTGVISTDS